MARDKLDLHGMRAEEVERVVDRFLVELSNSNLQKARILTGKGTGRVRSITIQYIERAGYTWSYERLSNGKVNEGCLIVYLE